MKPFRHDGRNQTRRRLLLPHSRRTLLSHSRLTSSVAIDPQGGSESRTAHLPAFAVIGLSSGWATIPSSSGGIEPRANESVLIDSRRGENETGDSASSQEAHFPFLWSEKAQTLVPRSNLTFLSRDELPLYHRSRQTLLSHSPSPRSEYLKISIKSDKFTGFFGK